MKIRLSNRSFQDDDVCIINHVPQRSNLWFKLQEKGKNTQQREHVFCASACLRGAIKVSVTWSQGLPRAQFLNPICDSPRPISISLFLNSTAALVSQWI